MYTTTINQNGLILLNKAAREARGVKLGDRVTINISKESATVKRELTDDEFFAQMDAKKSSKTKSKIRQYAGNGFHPKPHRNCECHLSEWNDR